MPVPRFLTLYAGPHSRQDCPVRFTLPEPLPPGEWELIAPDTDRPLPLQRLDGNEVAFVEPDLPAGQSRRYHCRPRMRSDGRFERYLFHKGFVTQEQLDTALHRQRQSGGDLTRILVEMGISPRDVYESKAHEMGVPFVDLQAYKPDSSALESIPAEVAARHHVLPVKRDGNKLWVAMGDTNNLNAADDLRLVSRCHVYGVLAVPEHIEEAIRKYYRAEPERQESSPAADEDSLSSEPFVRIKQEKHALAITVNGFLLTRYIYGDVPARPYFFPLLLPPGIGLTRVFPMQRDIPGETQDHPHHRSLWIAFGDVNGADNWSEEKGHGFTLHQSVNRLESGEVFGRFATTSLWTDADKSPLLTQDLEVTVWALSGTTRLLDFTIWLSASHGDVTFGDTKEGGILSARVASALDVPRGGRIENSYGGIDEAETWGKASHWCDYSGKIEGRPVGIAIMDHPLSFRYPTHWHVRDYGLMTANPFGYGAYTQGLKDGRHTIPSGKSLHFQYRLILHKGDAEEGHIRERYLDFVSPPQVDLTPSDED